MYTGLSVGHNWNACR